MALRFIDSFSHYRTAQLAAKWTSLGIIPPDIIVGGGRCTANALEFGTTSGCSATKGIAFSNASGIVGVAMKMTTVVLGGGVNVFYFGSVSNDHLSLRWNLDGSLEVWRQDPGPVLLKASAPDVVRMNEWFYIEFKAVIDAAGSYEVRVNGATVITGSGNTVGSITPAGLSFIRFQAAASSVYRICDLYALDLTGGTNNTFLGDTRIEYLHPDGAGAEQDWDVMPLLTPHWQTVYDSAGPDDDTSYIHTATAGLTETETFSNTGLPSGSIYGVQVSVYARKTDAGFRQIAPVVRHGGADFVGTNQEPSAASYRYLSQMYETNPGTGAAWAIGDVNAAEFGVKLTT